jgi:hypothetical protein
LVIYIWIKLGILIRIAVLVFPRRFLEMKTLEFHPDLFILAETPETHATKFKQVPKQIPNRIKNMLAKIQ